MRTVGDFKKAGLVFFKGDLLMDEAISYGGADLLNSRTTWDSECRIESFAWRTNTGVKPEFSGMIEVEYYFNHKDFGTKVVHSDCLDWEQLTLFKKWRPHLPAVIQTETPEEKEAFEAMNKSPYDVGAHVSDASKPVYTQAMRDAGEKVSKGMVFATACGEHEALEVNDKQVLFELDGYFVLETHEFVHPVKTERERAIGEIVMVISSGCAEVTGQAKSLDMLIGVATAIYDLVYRKACGNNK